MFLPKSIETDFQYYEKNFQCRKELKNILYDKNEPFEIFGIEMDDNEFMKI